MDIQKLISEMTLEEKASLCSGQDFWNTKAIGRLGIPAVMLSDGPHGLRKQDTKADHLGINDSIKAVCFPAGCATAASFDRGLVHEMGTALGESCQAEGISVILGPAANIKRSPLCGRNFEYYSEDPYLAAQTATSYIEGVQSKNVGTSLKHYLANNQEHRRMSSSSEVDERTLREIYLAAFEGAVVNAKPWTVMSSYNKINGEHASDSKKYLTEILRGEWGFGGYVVSDWGGTNDRVAGVKAGMDLEMPASGGINDQKIVAAVKDGSLKESDLDLTVEHYLTILDRFLANRKPDTVWDKESQHELVRKIAGECMVLLKNDGILPLCKEEPVAFIGKFADAPRFQGGGSSHINCFRTTSALNAAEGFAKVTYAQGYDTNEDTIIEAMLEEAVSTAKAAKTAVIFAGLPDTFESEGYDRSHMSLPNCQNELIRRVTAVQPNTIVVLHNGSPVEMPWVDNVRAVLEVYLGGQAVGGATVDVLFGTVNPSGKLPETFPVHLEDNPSYLYFRGEGDTVEYREGVFVGYRYYDKKKINVLFPFGHGLSYTSFVYSNLKTSAESMTDQETLTVTVDITNTGKTAGKEVVQLYVAPKSSSVIRPDKELKGYDKVELQPGQTKTVTFTLCKRAFAYWNIQIHDWYVESGEYDILVGASSRNILCSKMITVTGTTNIRNNFTLNSVVGDLLGDTAAAAVLQPFFEKFTSAFSSNEESTEAASQAIAPEMLHAMIADLPLRAILSFAGGMITEELLQNMLAQINK